MSRSSRASLNKWGIFLIELVLVLVILSAGLLYIIRGFSAALSASKESDGYANALSLMEERLLDLELKGQRQMGHAGGNFPDKGGYNWSEDVTSIKDLASLQVVSESIIWDVSRKIDVITYVQVPKK